jgi:hypothetical protein
MRKTIMIAGLFALAAALGPTAAVAQGKSGMQGAGSSSFKANPPRANDGALRGLARADKAAGTHGLRGRNIARTRGANNPGFCPPGQQKKLGLGSRFQC